MPSAWTLANVDELHAAHPKTFSLPALWRRQQFSPGCLVELIFLCGDKGGERMWVRIDERRSGRYRGTLESEPVELEGLHGGERIDFGPEHIADWKGRKPPAVPAHLTVSLSQPLRDPERFPRLVRREPPIDRNDSGLRLSWEADDAGPVTRLPLKDVLVFYESLAPLASVGDNGRWRWNDAECRYDPER